MKNIEKLKTILNREQLIAFLKEENNSYSTFILDRIDRNKTELYGTPSQSHHIIPEHRGGSNQQWNRMQLSIEEHAQAHKLLHEIYGYDHDLGAYHMINGQIELGFKTIRKIAQATMKEKNLSFWNRDVQRELGSRKKNRAPAARNKYILVALFNGFTLQHVISNETITIEPCECTSLVYVVEKLMAHPLMESKRESWETCKKKENFYALTALTRTLTGHVDERTKKSVFTFWNWRVTDINLLD